VAGTHPCPGPTVGRSLEKRAAKPKGTPAPVVDWIVLFLRIDQVVELIQVGLMNLAMTACSWLSR